MLPPGRHAVNAVGKWACRFRASPPQGGDAFANTCGYTSRGDAQPMYKTTIAGRFTVNRFTTTRAVRRHCGWALTMILGLAGCGGVEEPPPPPPEVGVLTLTSVAVPLNLTYTARTRGEREVEVRARVSGILQKRYYHEGAAVAADALLFRIDPAPFAAAVRSAEGRLGMEQARLAEAELQRERVRKLV